MKDEPTNLTNKDVGDFGSKRFRMGGNAVLDALVVWLNITYKYENDLVTVSQIKTQLNKTRSKIKGD